MTRDHEHQWVCDCRLHDATDERDCCCVGGTVCEKRPVCADCGERT